MSKSYLLLFLVIVIVIIIVGLFIELSYNKSHASYVFLAPQTMTVIKAKNLDISDDIILYNSETISLKDVLSKIPKSKQSKYIEQKIDSHLSKKFIKPFNDGYEDLKENFGNGMPVSLVYKTAVNIADITHGITSNLNKSTPFKMLVPRDYKWQAFIDNNNIYIKRSN